MNTVLKPKTKQFKLYEEKLISGVQTEYITMLDLKVDSKGDGLK